MSLKKKSEITPERIQKIIAQAGLASRREAEELIASGQVTVNGKTAKLGEKAQFGVDAIKVKGKLIQNAETKVYYLFFKPKNVIAMINEDEEGRATIKDYLKGVHERLFTVGRMDYSGEGAIILTNDGEMAQKLSKSNDLFRRYHVKVDRHPTQEDLARLARGGRIEKVSMNPHHIRVVSEYAKNALIEISFQGAGVTEIRKYFENKGFFPEKVTRVGIGHLKADKMSPGEIKKIDATSIQALLVQPELAEKLITNIVKSKSDNFKVIAGEAQIDYTTKSFTQKERDARKTEIASEKSSSENGGSENREKVFGRKKRDLATSARGEQVDSSARPSRRPPRGRPTPAEREAGIKRAPREKGNYAPAARSFGRDDGMPTPRFKREGGDRAPRGGDRPARGGGDRPSFGRGAPRGGDRPARSFGDRPARGGFSGGGDRPNFGAGSDRAPRGDRPSFGRGAPRGGDRPARSFGSTSRGSDRPARGGDRPSFSGGSDRAPRGDRPSFGRGAPRGGGDRPSFGGSDRAPRGDRPSFGRGAPRGGSDRPSFGGGDRARGDRPARPDGDRPSFGRGSDRTGGRTFGSGSARGGGKPAGRAGGGFKPRFK